MYVLYVQRGTRASKPSFYGGPAHQEEPTMDRPCHHEVETELVCSLEEKIILKSCENVRITIFL